MVCLFEMRDFVKLGKWKKASDRAGLNRRPLNLQSNALPLSYSRTQTSFIYTAQKVNWESINSIFTTLVFTRKYEEIGVGRDICPNTVNNRDIALIFSCLGIIVDEKGTQICTQLPK